MPFINSLPEAAHEGMKVCRAGDHPRFVERQAIAEDAPQQRDECRDGETLHEHGQHVFRTHKAAVEQRQPGDHHEQY
jgi:hypothetical protein